MVTNNKEMMDYLTQELPNDKDKKGSRIRILKMTHGDRKAVIEKFNPIIKDFATISENDYWMPRGLMDTNEARVEKEIGFLSAEHREQLTNWWLASTENNPNTPNWDFISTGKIKGKEGLILIEAKAHREEFKTDGKDTSKLESERSEANHKKIGEAIEEAKNKLNEHSVHGHFDISRDKYYQLSNRFAWSWKIASMGIPVVLVYLGFLNASEMGNGQERIFKKHEDWENFFEEDSINDIVPYKVWGTEININGTPLIPLIRSIERSD